MSSTRYRVDKEGRTIPVDTPDIGEPVRHFRAYPIEFTRKELEMLEYILDCSWHLNNENPERLRKGETAAFRAKVAKFYNKLPERIAECKKHLTA